MPLKNEPRRPRKARAAIERRWIWAGLFVLFCFFPSVMMQPVSASQGVRLVGVTPALSGVHFENHHTRPLLRLRFLVPQLDQSLLRDRGAEISGLMLRLCNENAAKLASFYDMAPQSVVISFMAEEIELGEIAPDVLQIFEFFDFHAGECVWSAF